jgi:hypothetical protein
MARANDTAGPARAQPPERSILSHARCRLPEEGLDISMARPILPSVSYPAAELRVCAWGRSRVVTLGPTGERSLLPGGVICADIVRSAPLSRGG